MQIGNGAWVASWTSFSLLLTVVASLVGPGPLDRPGDPVEMVRIAPGSFTMGSEIDSIDLPERRDDADPARWPSADHVPLRPRRRVTEVAQRSRASTYAWSPSPVEGRLSVMVGGASASITPTRQRSAETWQ